MKIKSLKYHATFMYMVPTFLCIVHPESFRSNTQIAIAFARGNRPRINCSNEFACVYLRLRAFAFASTVRDQPRAHACERAHVHACVCAYVRVYVCNVNSI